MRNNAARQVRLVTCDGVPTEGGEDAGHREKHHVFCLLLFCIGSTMTSDCWSKTAIDPMEQVVQKATCGPGDRTESVQGRTTLAERFGPGAQRAYNCNLELVGQFEGEGSAGYMSVLDKCVYYSTWEDEKMQHPGVVVLDVSDSARPTPTTYLMSPAMRNANEFLGIDPVRKILFANRVNTTTFEIYDLSTDCRYPVLKDTASVPGVTMHAGEFAPDYKTLYGGSCCTDIDKFPFDPSVPISAVFAVDTSDPSRLRSLATWIPPRKDWGTHAASVRRDGARVYASLGAVIDDRYSSGVAVLDVSDIQARRPNPHFRLVSTLFWEDSMAAEFLPPVTIRSHPYLIFTDILGSISVGAPVARPAEACKAGRPGWGFARIIDISNEREPKTVAKLMLEADAPASCERVRRDPTVVFGYGSLACGVDNDQDAKLLACGYNEAGLRVFDIRDPTHPKEIAYYKPPARRTVSHPGSVVRDLLTPQLKDHTADDVWRPMFFGPERIAFMSTDGGFQIVRFTDRFRDLHRELFAR